MSGAPAVPDGTVDAASDGRERRATSDGSLCRRVGCFGPALGRDKNGILFCNRRWHFGGRYYLAGGASKRPIVSKSGGLYRALRAPLERPSGGGLDRPGRALWTADAQRIVRASVRSLERSVGTASRI